MLTRVTSQKELYLVNIFLRRKTKSPPNVYLLSHKVRFTAKYFLRVVLIDCLSFHSAHQDVSSYYHVKVKVKFTLEQATKL